MHIQHYDASSIFRYHQHYFRTYLDLNGKIIVSHGNGGIGATRRGAPLNLLECRFTILVQQGLGLGLELGINKGVRLMFGAPRRVRGGWRVGGGRQIRGRGRKSRCGAGGQLVLGSGAAHACLLWMVLWQA